MVPTARFWVLAALGIPLAAATGSAGAPWIVAVYDLLLLAVAYGSTRLGPSAHSLRLSRRFDPVLSVRVANKIELSVSNDGVEPVSGVLRDEPPPEFECTSKQFSVKLEPGRESVLTYHLTPRERGSNYFRGTFLRVRCPLGLALRQVRLNTEQPIRVYPNVLALREFDLLKQKGRLQQIGIRQTRARGLGTEFESLRDYSDGDDFRKIDWKATARRGKLVVRQFEQERNQAVILCIDIGRRMLSEVNGVTKLDHALDSCLMLAHAAGVAGDQVGLLIYADTVRRYIPPRKSRHQAGMIIEALHDAVAEPVQTDPGQAFGYLTSRWKRRSLLVIFTDVEDEDQAKALTGAIGPLARRHISLVARVSDPMLKEASEGQITSADRMYLKAASLLFTSDRRRAGTNLDSAGIHSLDSEPQDLAAALVSFYFAVKERSLL